MRVTAPHMGLFSVAFTRVLRERGVDMVAPPKTTVKTLNFGVRHSPEFACLPFKINLGNMKEALDLGADAIIMPGGYGPCRFGYYGVVQESILRELGYKFEMASTDNPDKLGNVIKTISKLSGIQSKWEGFKIFYLILYRLWALDRAVATYHFAKPREINKGESDRALSEAIKTIDEAVSFAALLRACPKVKDIFGSVKIDRKFKPVKVGVLGEVFVVIEPFANMDVEKKLGNLRAEVVRGVWLSDWFNDRFRFKPLRRNQNKLSRRLAKGYLDYPSGGESIETVGKCVKFANNGLDGMVHVMPFTCMPELVASAVVSRISKERDFPVLSLTFDEHISHANIQTRVEAFVDLLERRRKSRA